MTPKQKEYYDERVSFFGKVRYGGAKVAIPHGLIRENALEMTDQECDEWLKDDSSEGDERSVATSAE